MVQDAGREGLSSLCSSDRVATGGQLFVRYKGDVVTDCAVGNNGDGRPMDAVTLFPSNCLTKPVVAIALMGLLERQEVDLGAAVSDILPPDLCSARGAPEWLRKTSIRIADLLNHSAGLLIPSAYELLMVGRKRAEQLVTSAPEPHHPGYSDFMAWWIVELLIQHLSGVEAHVYIREGLLAPNNLSESLILRILPSDFSEYRSRLGVWVGRPPRSVPFLSMLLPEFSERHRPAFSGLTTMNALGRFYGLVADSLAHSGEQAGFPTGDYLRTTLKRNRGTIYDRGLRKHCDFGGGFALDMRRELQADIGRESLGHSGGFIPSFGFADIPNEVVVTAYLNGMTRDFPQLEFIRSQLANSIYRDLGVTATDDTPSLW